MDFLKNLHNRTWVMIGVTIILIVISALLQYWSKIEGKYLLLWWFISTLVGMIALILIYLDTEEG